MKSLFVGFAAFSVLCLLAGCAPQLAQTPTGAVEASWQEAFRQSYPGYRPPRTAPPATVDNVSPRLIEQERTSAATAATEQNTIVSENMDPAELVDAAADSQAPAEAAAEEAKAEEVKEAPAKAEFTSTPPDPSDAEAYVVKAGDTLSGIAKKFYGDAGASGIIERANVDLVKNPNKLKPGMVLIIPKI
jgi:nucleoid-associated protein YgaU